MANYNNQYSMKITPNTPNLRGIDTNYSNDGKTNLGGIGLGDLYQLDYDRDKIEQIFNQGTDAKYALMQKENQIAQNNYASNQFANQQRAIESLRAQRNNQISSGMARGLNAAQEQGTILGLQQDASSGALELANQQQLEADKIATEYAANVGRALKEANSVKEAMANVAAQLYEADMMGYTGELGYMGQMDANASDRYGFELGLQGTQYTADKNLEGNKYNADRNLEGNKYTADRNLEGNKYTADRNLEGNKYASELNLAGTKYNADRNLEGTRYSADKSYAGQVKAAQAQAAAQRYSADREYAAAIARATGGGGNAPIDGTDFKGMVAKNTDNNGKIDYNALYGDLIGSGIAEAPAKELVASVNQNIQKGKQALNSSNLTTWQKALDGNNAALGNLGVNIFGQMKSNVNTGDAKKAVTEAQKQISNGSYVYTSNQQLMNDLKNGKFGHLRWGI